MVSWTELEGAIKESGKTPVEFAHSVGVSAVTVGMVKAGRPISPSSARKLLRAIKGGEDDEDL